MFQRIFTLEERIRRVFLRAFFVGVGLICAHLRKSAAKFPAAPSALVETADSYRFYFAVYVRKVGRLTRLCMALIDPFRKLIVYPSLLRSVRANWNRTIGAS